MTAIPPTATAGPTTPEDPDADRPSLARQSAGPRGPITLVLDLFSSVRLGIALMIAIFVYSSIGSAGVPVHPNILEPSSWRNVRELIEMSEFQWFHWWPFDLLIVLFCVNITTVTIRRIKFSVMNLGVWMIHSGLVVLAIGSMIYFTMKREGDAPVPRREVVIQVPGAAPATMVASPGNELIVGEGVNSYRFRVAQITPDWELLSGDDAGDRAYKVTMSVDGPGGSYLRELIDGFPQYTEDLVANPAGSPPFSRAINTVGRKIVDESVTLGLQPVTVDSFFLMETRAIYLREEGASEWVERPVPRMPLFRDHVRDYSDLWTSPSDTLDPVKSISVRVPAVEENDPLPDVDLTIVDYLRYAVMQQRRLPDGDEINPVIDVRMSSPDGNNQRFELAALDPTASTGLRGALAFHYAPDEAVAEQWLSPIPPSIQVTLPDGSVDDVPIDVTARMDPQLGFRPVGDSEYAWRVQAFEDGLEFEDRTLAVAIIEIRRGDELFTRWVFDDPALTRDVPDGQSIAEHAGGSFDPGINLAYTPGVRTAIHIVAGPEDERLRVSVPQPGGAPPQVFDVQPRQPVLIAGGLQLVIAEYNLRTRTVTQPAVIPRTQRDRDVGMMASMIRLQAPVGGTIDAGDGDRAPGDGVWEGWMPYHLYAFDGPEHVIRRFRYDPSVITLPDGRRIEVQFSRERQPLDKPVRLDSFEVVARIGGFSGGTDSIQDWRSLVSFAEDDGEWVGSVPVQMNQPKRAGQYWFFQAQWDPPDQPRFEGDPGSRGLNYTVLGVGNRHGVVTQLLGTIITVIGLMYVFYVKPWMRRRQLQAAYAAAGLGPEASRAAAATGEPPATASASADTPEEEPATAGGERS